MFRLAIFFSCAAIVSGKLINSFNFSQDVSGSDYDDTVYNKEPLWVLKLNEDIWDSLEIRKANAIDEANFKTYAVPMVNRYLQTRNTVVKKDSAMLHTTKKPERREENPKEIKTKLFMIINKFLIFKNHHPNNDDQLENYTEPPITIYFKGPFTAILVQHDFRHWLYFIPPPSPLPSWLYQQHGNIVTGVIPDVVPIPDDVTLQLYPALLSLMEKMLSYPL